MSIKKRELDLDLLAAVIDAPGRSITNITQQFSEKESPRTTRRKLVALADSGLISLRKEQVARPTPAGLQYKGNARPTPREE